MSFFVGQDDPMSELFSGDYEIVGEHEIYGANAQALAKARAAGGVLVADRPIRREYTQVLPATSEAIAAGASRVITLTPQRPFRPEFFRASSTHTAPFFVISGYTVGQDNQFVGPGDIPCDIFSEVALYSGIKGYTANLGTIITLTVRNIDAAQRDFRAAFLGTSLAQ